MHPKQSERGFVTLAWSLEREANHQEAQKCGRGVPRPDLYAAHACPVSAPSRPGRRHCCSRAMDNNNKSYPGPVLRSLYILTGNNAWRQVLSLHLTDEKIEAQRNQLAQS